MRKEKIQPRCKYMITLFGKYKSTLKNFAIYLKKYAQIITNNILTCISTASIDVTWGEAV